jgi:hypothetical protein
MRYKTHWLMTAVLTSALFAGLYSANGADFLSSYDPPPKTLNGAVQIQAGRRVSNQFTLFPIGGATEYKIDQVILLFDTKTTDDDLAHISVTVNKEAIVNGSPQPDGLAVTFGNGPIIGEETVNNKKFKSVAFTDGGSLALPSSSTSQNYWLIVENKNSRGSVDWAKTSSNTPIFNADNSGSINPDTLNFVNGIGWQKPTGGNGNQIMLFALNAPEPSTYILGTIVAGVLALTARNPRFRRIHRRGENESDSEALANSAEAAQAV